MIVARDLVAPVVVSPPRAIWQKPLGIGHVRNFFVSGLNRARMFFYVQHKLLGSRAAELRSALRVSASLWRFF